MHKRMWGIMGNMACCSPGVQVLSMRDAVFIVSPKMLNLGSLLPTTPLTQGPVWMPMRMTTGVPSFGMRTCWTASHDNVKHGRFGNRFPFHSHTNFLLLTAPPTHLL